MNFLVFLQSGASQQGGGGTWSFLIMMLLIFGVMYFFMIRPQQKRQKELAKFRSNLAKGDKVITMGGIYGVIVDVKDQYVIVEVDNNVKLKVDKGSIVKDSSDIQAAGK
ncbi:MAG: preprotein translocase subunit YajC [Rikenellaceae bacterium]|jgi:preprotein translocase subunit YajC|nr:preprotein translocase subunit YajC [Bacteroidales bacterium]